MVSSSEDFEKVKGQSPVVEGLGKGAWKLISIIHSQTGHSYHRLFRDWLDLMLLTFLSQTAKGAGNLKQHEAYEQKYLSIVDNYKDNRNQGKRNIDLFAKAMAELVNEMTETEQDVLGALYMEHISSGEGGQFFTPEPITEMMVKMINPTQQNASISDPACGSGRMLLAAHKVNPSAHLFGTDVDEQCAKMCALNCFLFGCRATVVWGNTLTTEAWACWDIGFVYMFERDPVAMMVQQKVIPLQVITPQKMKTDKQMGFDF